MRCGLLVCLLLLVGAPTAAGARHDVTVQATPTTGAAPLQVTFTSSEDVTWDFGDGSSCQGASVTHVYAAGRRTASWSSANGSGTVEIVAHGIVLSAPRSVRYGARATLRGRLIPAEQGVSVSVSGASTVATTSRGDGTFAARPRILRGAVWTAKTTDAASAGQPLAVTPQLRARLLGSGARGERYVLAANIRPAAAGRLAVTIRRGGTTVVDHVYGSALRLRLDTRRLASYTIKVRIRPNELYTAAERVLHAHVVFPRLVYGTRGSAVAQLGQRLRELHYAAPFAAAFDSRMLDAVYAFEKVQGLARTGAVDLGFWRRLETPRVPAPRYAAPAAHIEIDKQHQVLYIVRGSRVTLIVPVSTAGLPGKFTPVGRFSIYRKVDGFDPSPLGTLYDPMYFTGGYAIHGNPSVPPYPASHGCVRVPMWLAPILYATNPYGETVYVY